MSSITKTIATILSFLQFIFCGISYGEFGEKIPEETEETKIVNNIDGHTNMADSIKFANEVKNQAQARYTTPERTAYEFKNSNMILTHSLTKNNSATLTDLEGNVYIPDSFDTYFIDDSGKTYYSSSSSSEGRVNIIRLGEYYYECHVRDFDGKSKDFKVDKTYHLYGDKLYNQSTLFAAEATTSLKEFGNIIRIPADTVVSFQAKDKSGVHINTTGETATAEYVAFDIKNVGIVGFIIPSDGSTKLVSLHLEDGYYVLKLIANYTAGTGINKNDETGGYSLNNVTFGTRIYTDKTHSFEGIQKETYLEINPLD